MKTPLVIILNDIRSTLNVGAMLRTADAVAAQKVYLCGITATPDHPKVAKTSLGAEKSVEWEYVADVKLLIKNLKLENYQILGLEIDQKAENFWNAKYYFPLALIVGNEIEGITEEIMSLCDKIVEIPMRGQKESLNVATASGIALYEIAKPFLK